MNSITIILVHKSLYKSYDKMVDVDDGRGLVKSHVSSSAMAET